MRRGSLTEQFLTVKHADGSSVKRGPYPLLTRKQASKTVSVRLTDPALVPLYRQKIQALRQFEGVVDAFVKRGIVPESGGTWYLPRLLGWSKAAEIIFTGRTLLADECKALGLAEVVPDGELMPAARKLAAEIAANAPLAVQSSKRLVRMGQGQPFNDHVHHVYLNFVQLMRTDDAREGMASFVQKRQPDFKGR